MWIKIISSLGLICALTGCASVEMARKYEIMTSDHISKDEDSKLRTLTGDRRLIRQSAPSVDGTVEICAETQADAITAYTGQGQASVGYSGATIAGTNNYGEAATLTTTRGEISDVVRQLAWHYCNAHMNGWLNDDAYRAALSQIELDAFVALKARAQQPKPADGGAQSGAGGDAAKAEKKAACVKDAGSDPPKRAACDKIV